MDTRIKGSGLKAVMAFSLAVALGLSMGTGSATAAIYGVLQDTYVYEQNVNFGGGAAAGDSNGIQVWRNMFGHGGKGLIQFVSGAVTEATALGVGGFTATLNLYEACNAVDAEGCPGDPFNIGGADSTTTQTDIFLQGTAWDEAFGGGAPTDSPFPFSTATETGTPFATFTESSTQNWLAIDVTALVNAWVGGVADNGFSLSQQNYAEIRVNHGTGQTFGKNPVSIFCDSESTGALCSQGSFAPTLAISSVPVPASVWLFGSGLIGMVGIARRRRSGMNV